MTSLRGPFTQIAIKNVYVYLNGFHGTKIVWVLCLHCLMCL